MTPHRKAVRLLMAHCRTHRHPEHRTHSVQGQGISLYRPLRRRGQDLAGRSIAVSPCLRLPSDNRGTRIILIGGNLCRSRWETVRSPGR
jgi:hypothetical protein